MSDETDGARELATILDSIEESIISTTVDGIVLTMNQSAERMFGYTAREMVGSSISVLTPLDRRDHERQVFDRVRRGERFEFYETQRLKKDTRVIDVELTLLPRRDVLGHVVGIVNIARDLMDRKRLDQAERDQFLLASLISSADDAIVSKNLDGIVTSWNRSAEKLFGYTAEEMIGKPIHILIPPDRPEEETQILERIRRGERIEHYETQRIRKDGRVMDIVITVSPLKDALGRIIGASKIARDITDRKRWEKAELAQSFLGALVASAEDAIVSKTLEGIVTSWNPAAERLFGYRAEEIVGKSIVILIPEGHPNEEPEILARIRRGERIEHYETKRVRKDGSLVDIALTVSPIKDLLGRIIGASKIARDITQQKQAEAREREALRQAQEASRMAEEANSAKDEFLATISHELRTPMTAILGWTRMLMSGEVGPENQRKALETIDRNARSQAQLIEDLLDISRIVSGKLRIEYKLVDMAAVVAASLEAVRLTAETKRIRIQTNVAPGSVPVLGDAERLQQVVWNLLSNSIKFTPAGGVVEIQLQRAESRAELQVIDNGIGIRSELLPHIFDRFTQGDSSITRSYGGLGMGLAIVKSLTELHGGTVTAKSEGEGLGAAFTVKLPISSLRYDPRRQTRPETSSLKTGLNQAHELVGLKILVVDDERDTCDLLRLLFNECGAIVQTTATAADALRVFDEWRPDILVSDIGMPGTDGYELIRAIRKDRGSRIPAVALTAMARIEDRIKALSRGYQLHVPKPVEPAELISIVSSLVGLVDHRPRE